MAKRSRSGIHAGRRGAPPGRRSARAAGQGLERAVLSRAGAEIAKLSPAAQDEISAKFRAEVATKDGKAPIDPTAFLGDRVTGTEVAKAWRDEYMSASEGGVVGRGAQWACQHGPQAFVNFIPALEGTLGN